MHHWIPVLFVLSLSINSVCAQSDVQSSASYKCTDTVPKPGGTIVINLGKQPVGEEVKLNVEVTNDSGISLDLAMIPACGCTQVVKGNNRVGKGEKLNIDLEIKCPQMPQILSSGISCVDQDSEYRFSIVIVAEIIPVLHSMPQISECNSDLMQEIEVSIETNFSGLEAKNLKVLSGNASVLRDTTDGLARKVTFLYDASKVSSSELLDEIIVECELSTTIEGLVSSKERVPEREFRLPKSGAFLVHKLPIRFNDRIRLSPSLILPRLDAERYKLMIVVSGAVRNFDTDEVKVFLSNNGSDAKLKLNLNEVKKRGDIACVVIASIDQDTLAQWLDSELSSERTIVSIECGALTGKIFADFSSVKKKDM